LCEPASPLAKGWRCLLCDLAAARVFAVERDTDLWTSDGAKFVSGDRLLDAAATGPRWLLQPVIADAVVSILLGGRFELGAWVVMLNHVHIVLRPCLDLPKTISGIKACSARDANRLLGRVGRPFWARDYFDRWIRNGDEEQRITRYIEYNPVKAGLCLVPEDWPWSSAKRGYRRVSLI
jgi:REP element-mobilizing transposase RayT